MIYPIKIKKKLLRNCILSYTTGNSVGFSVPNYHPPASTTLCRTMKDEIKVINKTAPTITQKSSGLRMPDSYPKMEITTPIVRFELNNFATYPEISGATNLAAE